MDGFEVSVDEAKLTYVKTAKTGSVTRAGLEAMTSNELSKLIRQKLSSSYIYNMAHDEVHGITKFNVIIEVPGLTERTRLLAALEYQPDQRVLRLITLY